MSCDHLFLVLCLCGCVYYSFISHGSVGWLVGWCVVKKERTTSSTTESSGLIQVSCPEIYIYASRTSRHHLKVRLVSFSRRPPVPSSPTTHPPTHLFRRENVIFPLSFVKKEKKMTNVSRQAATRYQTNQIILLSVNVLKGCV